MPAQMCSTLPGHVSLVDPRMSPWLNQINVILSSPTIMQAMLNCREVAAHIQALLLALLREEGSPYAPNALRRNQIVSRDVRRAEAFMRLNATSEITLDDVVQVSGVSTRALQNNFMRFRQVSPMQYLRELRLQLVQQRLLDDADTAFISQVALDCGFNHLGRFSVFYKVRYGETLSQTTRLSLRK